MAKLTISDAARACGVARTTIQRAVRSGRLSLDAERQVDTAELLRVGFLVDAAVLHAAPQQGGAATPQDAAPWRSTSQQGGAASQELQLVRQERDLLRQERDRMAQQMEVLLALHQATQQALLQAQQTLHAMQQRYDRLLEAPRPAAPAQPPRPAPRVASPRQPAPQDLPAPWQEVLTWMQEHPGPQRPQDVQQALGWTQTARHAMRHMADAGLLSRVRPGVYHLPTLEDNH